MNASRSDDFSRPANQRLNSLLRIRPVLARLRRCLAAMKEIVGVLTILSSLAGCQPTNVSPILTPRTTSTPDAPPAETINLAMVDVTEGLIQLPVREQLLVRACEAGSHTANDDETICDIGLVSFEHARFVRLRHVKEWRWSCPQFAWSPTGTQFAYYSHGVTCWNDYTSTVYRADGSKEYRIPSDRIAATALWSIDGQYFAIKSCQAGNPSPGHRYTVYNASSWTPACQVGWSDPMGPCAYDVTQSGLALANQCALPLVDGREWILNVSRSNYPAGDLAIRVCNNSEDCSVTSPLDSTPATKRLEPCRYQASIDNYWLRVTDTKNGDEKTYQIPGYVITTIAWPPAEAEPYCRR